MMPEDDERSSLIGGNVHHSYGIRPSLIRQRSRQVRQFQCCMFAIFISAVVVVLIFTLSYNISPVPPNNSTEQNSSELNAVSLLARTWPLNEASHDEFVCHVNTSEWEKALAAGMKALQDRDQIESDRPKMEHDSPSYRHQKAFVSSRKTKMMARMGYLQESARKYLKRHNVSVGCKMGNETMVAFPTIQIDRKSCNSMHKYRSYNGSCNNLKSPSTYGVAFNQFRRVLPSDYADGISRPRASKDGKALPSARLVSLEVHRPLYRSDENFTAMLAVWGQFLDHDITATALSQSIDGEPISCCMEPIHPDCYPVPLTHDDPLYRDYNITCMEFVRSAPAPTYSATPRQQINQVSSFIDGSVVYGADEETVKKLRSFEGGKLLMYTTPENVTLLPISLDPDDGCNNYEENRKGRYCFMTGDQRANENVLLTSMHLIWAKHHNFLASELAKLNPHWTDEKIFQEARRIVGAQMQHIAYNEFLPILITDELLSTSGLKLNTTGYYHGYNSSLDSSVSNNFAAASFRFGHTLLPGLIKMLGSSSDEVEYVQLHRMLFDPFRLYRSGELARSLRGAMNTSVEASDPYFTSEIKDHLFERTDLNNGSKKCGLDLVTLNIQRGRDHGLPGYVSWREHCKLVRSRNFTDLAGEIDDGSLGSIQNIYKYIEDIDLYTGGVSEKPIESSSFLGPTFTCLLVDQFVRLKRGDRFWYENPDFPHSFTEDQLNELRLSSLAGIICDNSDEVDHVQTYVMRRAGEGNPYRPCTEIPRPYLAKWKDGDLPRISISDYSLSVKAAGQTENVTPHNN